MNESREPHHVVIIGGGFGGLYAAKQLGKRGRSVKVTLIDKRNFHLFQPLLYQVATGGLSPGDIASPLRAVLNRYKNVNVLKAEVTDIRLDRLKGRAIKPFRYLDKGSLAVIGRNAAVADFGIVKFSGFFAWFAWVFIHIAYLIEFDNRLLVLFQWGWNYITRKKGARLITDTAKTGE